MKYDLLKIILLSIFVAFIFCKCTEKQVFELKDSGDSTPYNNQPPEPPKVQILSITYKSAVITWTPAKDRENDVITYSLRLDDSLLIKHTSVDTLIELDHLNSESVYGGTLTFTDSINKLDSIPFTFTTLKYENTYSKMIDIFKSSAEVGYDIKYTNDGGFVVSANVSFSGSLAIYIGKFDSLCFKIWDNTFEDNTLENKLYVLDNGYLVMSDSKVRKLNADGKLAWNYPNELSDAYSFKSCCIDNNQITIIGDLPHPETGERQSVITCLDGNGKLVNKTVMNFAEFDVVHADYALTSIVKSDDNYVILGYKRNPRQEDDSDILLMKVTKDGELIWDDLYNDTFYNMTQKLLKTNDGGYILVANMVHVRRATAIHLIKTNSIGEMQWEKHFQWDYISTSAQDALVQEDNKIVICGSDGSNDDQQAMILRLDENGEVELKKFYKPEYMDYSWNLRGIVITKDGYIATGVKGWVWNGYGKEGGLWVLKTDWQGDFNE